MGTSLWNQAAGTYHWHIQASHHCWSWRADLTGKPARRASRSRSRSRSPDQSASAGASIGRRNSGRSGPVASDQAKSSAYKGVSWHKHSQKWYAYIQSGGKMRGLGYFDSQADAAKAYDTEARKVLLSLLEARPPACPGM